MANILPDTDLRKGGRVSLRSSWCCRPSISLKNSYIGETLQAIIPQE